MNPEINQLQKEIQEKQQKLIELRKQVPLEEIKDYNFIDKNGNPVSLRSLFQDNDELLVVHNMGKECRYCTMWADGFRGYNEIINDRMPWVLTSPNTPDDLKEFAESRDWNFNYVSFNGTSFAKDLGFEYEKDGRTYYNPGVSALIIKDNNIYRSAKDNFGPGDLYNPAWHFFDLFPKGANNWQPKYEY